MQVLHRAKTCFQSTPPSLQTKYLILRGALNLKYVCLSIYQGNAMRLTSVLVAISALAILVSCSGERNTMAKNISLEMVSDFDSSLRGLNTEQTITYFQSDAIIEHHNCGDDIGLSSVSDFIGMLSLMFPHTEIYDRNRKINKIMINNNGDNVEITSFVSERIVIEGGKYEIITDSIENLRLIRHDDRYLIFFLKTVEICN